MSVLSRRVLAFALSVATLSPAAAQDGCARLNVRDDQLRNGSVLFYTEQGWYPFVSFGDVKLSSIQRIWFAYVVRTREGQSDRSGVVVIKSAIYPRPLGRQLTPAEEKVQLVKREAVADPGCPVSLPYEGSLVSAKGYEDYHEFEATETPELRSGPDLQSIKRFHVAYRAEAGCVRTDDFLGQRGIHPNASQFSFNPSTVDRGPQIGFAFNFFGKAYAERPRLLERRSEIRHYQTAAGRDCIVFDLPVNGDERNSLRINDLEGRELLPVRKRQPEFRADDRG